MADAAASPNPNPDPKPKPNPNQVPDAAAQGKGSLSHLSERKAWLPVPAADLYAAARYTLSHEVLTHVHAGGAAAGEDNIHARSRLGLG